MTSQSPRVYTYKITFEETPYYYYGVHKEKRYNEYYMGSPVTHKWYWDFYTPKKQILELFEFSDEGWLKAQNVEDRLIKPVLNEPLCLNESCGRIFSIRTSIENGKKQYENKVGIHTQTLEDKIELGRKTGLENFRLGRGFFKLTTEERRKYAVINGHKKYQEGVGIFSIPIEERIEFAKMNCKKLYEEGRGLFSMTTEERVILGRRNYENGLGIAALTKEQKIENSSKGGKKSSKVTNSQRWECCETGYISTAAGVVQYQKGKGIDTSKNNRKKIS